MFVSERIQAAIPRCSAKLPVPCVCVSPEDDAATFHFTDRVSVRTRETNNCKEEDDVTTIFIPSSSPSFPSSSSSLSSMMMLVTMKMTMITIMVSRVGDDYNVDGKMTMIMIILFVYILNIYCSLSTPRAMHLHLSVH